jgi:hypothetical protein
MGFSLRLPTSASPLVWWTGCETPVGLESRSPLPAFKNLGRGVF